jgi:hypothetical protein
MTLVSLQAAADQLGAPADPPQPLRASAIAVRVHESWINNLASSLLAGQTVTADSMRNLAQERFGEVPERLKLREGQEPWSIEFDAVDPVTVVFGPSTLQCTVRGRRYKSGERSFGAMNVSVTYRVESRGDALRLVRQGELEILPPDYRPGKTLSPRQVTLRTLLRNRLEELLEKEIIAEARPLPPDWQHPAELVLRTLRSAEGWLTLGWQLEATKSTRAETAPAR